MAASPSTRRGWLLAHLGAPLLAAAPGATPAADRAAPPPASAATREGQRQGDQGDGQFCNPVLAGDRPDPTVLKVGRDYYMTHSSFEAVPGLLIWHSRDLVNWQPLGHALTRYLGSVWAPELCQHQGRYYLYVPTKHPQGNDIWVTWADDVRGPWSEPVALGIDRIDPGHAVDEQGRRFLFLNGGQRVRLSDDGLRTAGPLETVFEGWRYPEDWDVESYAQEGPKLTRHGGWWHMTLALGGTAGPTTGHMVVSARARTLDGPWTHSPHNPVVRTRSAREAWWSRGHATLVEGPTPGDWYMLSHGYENGWRTLGRQTLLEPIEWTAEGWYRAPRAAQVATPQPLPRGGSAVPHGLALSDDFSGPALGPQWSFHQGSGPHPPKGAAAPGAARVQVGGGSLRLAATGSSPADSPPLCCVQGDRHFQVEVDLVVEPGAQGGLLAFYNERLYAGLGVDARGYWLHRYGQDQRRGSHETRPVDGQPLALRLRMTLVDHVLTFHTSRDQGATWRKYGTQMEVSGYHHNVAGGFMSLRPALYAAGRGAVRFARWRYRALPAPNDA